MGCLKTAIGLRLPLGGSNQRSNGCRCPQTLIRLSLKGLDFELGLPLCGPKFNSLGRI